MQLYSRTLPWVGWVVAVMLCASPSATAAATCQFDKVHFSADFPSGRLDECKQLSESDYLLTVAPENKPINPSPWYAFRAESQVDAPLALNLIVRSAHGKARYTPKASIDKRTWAELPHTFHDDRVAVAVTLQPDSQLYIAGQELIDNRSYTRWLASLLNRFDTLELSSIGQSTQHRPLPALIHRAAASTAWLVIIGRQHPPEITGALALMHFSETLFAADELASLREHYNILLVPNMNPDGVHAGNWRHTSTGLDMNRDWKARTQPETQALHNFLQARVAAGERIWFALDFHSTHRNVYYTMPSHYVRVNGQPLAEPQLVDNWLERLASVIDYDVENKPGHNADSGVFKQYIADEYGVHAVTYEVGDRTDRNEIAETARAAALALALAT
ncbi:MAG TPA: M14-type cytosolic carboxypeptidase, partial [Pseudidiomarina sp.]|nr:M14-type cytosolic carboxypeptidase [Pseudidiomarina sp.]